MILTNLYPSARSTTHAFLFVMDATGKVQLSEPSDAAPLGVTMAYTTGLISKQEKNKLKFLLFE